MSIDADLRGDGISVRDQFLAPAQIRSLVECAQLRRARGEFDAARIGGNRSLQRRAEIRGDSTCWITAPLLPAEQVLLEELEHLRLALNREALLSGRSELLSRPSGPLFRPSGPLFRRPDESISCALVI